MTMDEKNNMSKVSEKVLEELNSEDKLNKK